MSTRRPRLTPPFPGLKALQLFLLAAAGTVQAADQQRYMSLKVDKVELRPSPDASVSAQWIFRRAGMPVEVLGVENGWARVRDNDSATGWVKMSLLSRRRTALVLRTGPDAQDVALRADDRDTAGIVALLEPGLLLNLFECDGQWCLAGLNETRGYIAQKQLWGVAPGEAFK